MLIYPKIYITITHLTPNSTEELLHPNVIMLSLLSVSIKNCHAASEYYESIRLYSGEYGLIPLPSRHRRQDKANNTVLDRSTANVVIMVMIGHEYN